MSYTIVIPSKDTKNLNACIQALRDRGEDGRILVMDDGLNLMELWPAPGVEFIPCDPPFVYARNCNRGIELAGADDVVLLNDDALLGRPHGIAALAAAAADHPEYGIVSAATNVTGNPDQWPRSYLAGVRSTDRCTPFICTYIPAYTIARVGLLDERFTAYGYEDQDYCRRVRNAGLKVGILDACFVDHGLLKSTFRGAPNAPADLTEGRKIYIAKWGNLD